jgi:hypothetical protein
MITKGLEVRAYMRKAAEKIISPIVNSDRVFWYMLMYIAIRKISRTIFTEEITVFAV